MPRARGRCPPRRGLAAARRWLRPPERRQRRWSRRCGPRTVERGDDGGAARSAASTCATSPREHGTPAYVLDEDDFRARARAFRDGVRRGLRRPLRRRRRLLRRQGVPVHRGRPLGGRGGPAPRRLHRRRARRRAAGRASRAARIGLHGNNKSTAEIARALAHGVGRIVVDSFDEIDRVAAVGEPARRRGARAWCASPSASRRTPTSSSRPPTRTRSSASPWPAARPPRRSGRILAHARPARRCSACTPTSAPRSSTPRASRSPPTGCVGLHAAGRRRARRRSCPSSTSAAASASPTPPQHDPLPPADLARRAGRHRRPRVRAADGVDACPRISVEPGRAIAGPSTFTLYEVGTVKDVELDGGAQPHLRLRRRRHERQHPHRALRRRLLVHPRQPRLDDAPPAARPRRRQALRERRHRRQGRVPARPTSRPGDLLAVPGTGAYCRSLASQYNHVPRPPVVAVRDGAGAASSSAARPRRTCSPSTSAEWTAGGPLGTPPDAGWRHPESRWTPGRTRA